MSGAGRNIGLLVLLGAAAIWYWPDRDRESVQQSTGDSTAEPVDRAPVETALAVEPVAGIGGAPAPRPGSTEARLLETTDQQRALMFSTTVRDEGYECGGVLSARPIVRDGSSWRVNCGNAQIYRLSVSDVGHLSARPMPYGDVDGVRTPAPVVAPDDEGVIRVSPEQR